MRRICAWCWIRLDENDAGDPTPTHGICHPCRDKLEREWELVSVGGRPQRSYRDRVAIRWRALRRKVIVTLGRWARPRDRT